KWCGIDTEHPQLLALVVFVDLEVAPGEAGDGIALRVLYSDRDFDEVHINHKPGYRTNAFFRRRGLELVRLSRRLGGLRGSCCRFLLRLIGRLPRCRRG